MTPREQVLKFYPEAHSSDSGGKFRIVRPKLASDKATTLDDIPLTRACDTEDEAWESATRLPKVRGK